MQTKTKEIIDKHDPIYLLRHGAPDDEYSSEISLIDNNIFNKDQWNINEIKDMVKDVFDTQFYENSISNEQIDDISSDLYYSIIGDERDFGDEN